jgi:hypothetical protein
MEIFTKTAGNTLQGPDEWSPEHHYGNHTLFTLAHLTVFMFKYKILVSIFLGMHKWPKQIEPCINSG